MNHLSLPGKELGCITVSLILVSRGMCKTRFVVFTPLTAVPHKCEILLIAIFRYWEVLLYNVSNPNLFRFSAWWTCLKTVLQVQTLDS